MLEGLAVGGHEHAHVPRTAATEVEAGEVGACVWVDDAVPGLFGGGAARAGPGPWGWPGHLVEHFEAVVLLFDHLGPGEAGPGVAEGAADFLGWGFGQAGDEGVAEARVSNLLHAAGADVEVRQALERVPVIVAGRGDGSWAGGDA